MPEHRSDSYKCPITFVERPCGEFHRHAGSAGGDAHSWRKIDPCRCPRPTELQLHYSASLFRLAICFAWLLVWMSAAGNGCGRAEASERATVQAQVRVCVQCHERCGPKGAAHFTSVMCTSTSAPQGLRVHGVLQQGPEVVVGVAGKITSTTCTG